MIAPYHANRGRGNRADRRSRVVRRKDVAISAPETSPDLKCIGQMQGLFTLVLSICAVMIGATPGHAQVWRQNGTVAGLYVDGAPNGLFLRCAGRSVTVNFSGFTARLPEKMTYRVGVSVDGLARILPTTSYRLRGSSVLVHQSDIDTIRPLIEDLRRGKSVEVTTPAGRYDVPLKGSAAALDGLVRGCS
ncbi:hypothetical protein SAMN06297251_104145 [Fulvimarina manganoxydans]|uniref:Uncharacterized protein n=1 Tax=Fulvimarina manganoxydans TaxID=937218 RepID=A0A1W2AFM0_9HYPH|nr:hypothetical protein SAMN06297251_104145 [Fulvimarina manganoxydans]